MFRLELFGGAALRDESGLVRGRAVHRRRLAVLAVLALARTGRVGRERLIGLLWPESDADAARHLLSESLYHLRRVLGDDAFVVSGDEVGLGPGALWCDVTAFDAAIAVGDLETAVGLYAGPVLDGFYVADASDFERWAESERQRAERTYSGALGQLADTAEAQHRLDLAVEWWQRLLEVDPHSARVVLRLMRVLEALGDRAAALRLADEHAARLRSDLGAGPEPSVLALAARLRDAPSTATPLPLLRPIGAVDAPPEPQTAGTPEPSAEPARVPEPPIRPATGGAEGAPLGPGRWGTLARLVGWSSTRRVRHTAVLVGAVVGVLLVRLASGAWGEGSAPAGAVNVMVLPVAAGGELAPATAAALQRLLAGSLAAVPRIWTMDAARSLGSGGAWRELPHEQLIAWARARSARYVVAAEILDRGAARVVVTAYDVPAGEQVARATGAADEPLDGAVQRIALEIARAIALRERLALGDVGYLLAATDAPAALSHFLLGRDLFRASDFDQAAAEFRRAIRADSAFLLAYHRLSVTETWSPRWDFAAARAAVDAGLRWREEVAPIYGRLLDAQRRFVLREGARAITEFQWLTVDDPHLIDGWLGLGEALYHHRGLLGGRPADALAAFERVVAADSALAPPYEHLTEIAITLGDEPRARRYATRVATPRAREAFRLAVQLRFGTRRERARAVAVLDTTSRNTVSTLVRIFADRPGMVDTLGTILMRPTRSPNDRRWGSDYRLVALAAQGRWLEGAAAWQSQPAAEPFDKWVVAADLAGHPAGTLAGPMYDWAWATLRSAGGPDLSGSYTPTRDPFRALVHAAVRTGDSATVAQLLTWLEQAAPGADAADPEPAGLRGSLHARLQLLARDTTAAVRELERALERAPWWVSAWAPLADAAPERLILATLYAATGQDDSAARWLNSFGNVGAVADLLYRPAVGRLRASMARHARGGAPPAARPRPT